MRLQLDTLSGSTNDVTSVSTSGSGSTAERGKFAATPDNVSVSTLTTNLNLLASDHAAKLKQIASAVADGSYRIPTSALTSAIISYSLASK